MCIVCLLSCARRVHCTCYFKSSHKCAGSVVSEKAQQTFVSWHERSSRGSSRHTALATNGARTTSATLVTPTSQSSIESRAVRIELLSHPQSSPSSCSTSDFSDVPTEDAREKSRNDSPSVSAATEPSLNRVATSSTTSNSSLAHPHKRLSQQPSTLPTHPHRSLKQRYCRNNSQARATLERTVAGHYPQTVYPPSSHHRSESSCHLALERRKRLSYSSHHNCCATTSQEITQDTKSAITSVYSTRQ